MSATAQMWASTHNESLKEKMSALVAALGECQEKMGTGYLSAFPFELFDRFEDLKPVWAPYYTIHKVPEDYKYKCFYIMITMLCVINVGWYFFC